MLGAGKACEHPGEQVSCSWDSSFVKAQLGSRDCKGFTPKGGVKNSSFEVVLSGPEHHLHLTHWGKRKASAFRMKNNHF